MVGSVFRFDLLDLLTRKDLWLVQREQQYFAVTSDTGDSSELEGKTADPIHLLVDGVGECESRNSIDLFVFLLPLDGIGVVLITRSDSDYLQNGVIQNFYIVTAIKLGVAGLVEFDLLSGDGKAR